MKIQTLLTMTVALVVFNVFNFALVIWLGLIR